MLIVKFFIHPIIILYRYVCSPILPPACRFEPSCSQYSFEAFDRFGLYKGFLLTVKRLGKCHPWGGYGYDPVPLGEKNER